MELAWLLNRAAEILNQPKGYYNAVTEKLVDHAVTYGLDKELGGVYRDGLHDGTVLVTDKEWWQNCEVLVGFLDAYENLEKSDFYDAFDLTWNFDYRFLINHEVGEWRQLVDKTGKVLVDDIGNPWKAIYHSGRSMLECKVRLERLIDKNR